MAYCPQGGRIAHAIGQACAECAVQQTRRDVDELRLFPELAEHGIAKRLATAIAQHLV